MGEEEEGGVESISVILMWVAVCGLSPAEGLYVLSELECGSEGRESRATAGGRLGPLLACKTRAHLGRPRWAASFVVNGDVRLISGRSLTTLFRSHLLAVNHTTEAGRGRRGGASSGYWQSCLQRGQDELVKALTPSLSPRSLHLPHFTSHMRHTHTRTHTKTHTRVKSQWEVKSYCTVAGLVIISFTSNFWIIYPLSTSIIVYTQMWKSACIHHSSLQFTYESSTRIFWVNRILYVSVLKKDKVPLTV